MGSLGHINENFVSMKSGEIMDDVSYYLKQDMLYEF
jgi:hypothetical protein